MKKNILITGTSKGIGRFLLDNLKIKNHLFGISRTKTNNSGIEEFNIDLTDFNSFKIISENLKSKNIKLDAIIINAGLGYFGKYENGTSEKYKEIIDLNLLSPILFLKEIEPFLTNKSKIIFLGSIISKKFMKYGAVYQASKFGLRGFAGGLKNEMKGIHIINPRIVDTDFHNNAEITIDMKNRETTLDSILETVKKILSGDEKKFEIDL